MKTLSASLKALVVACLACAAGLAAAATGDLVVKATVKDVCTFASVPALGFSIDPSAPTSQSGFVTVTYKCTKGKTPIITATTGSLTGRTLTRALGGTMTYDLSLGAFPTSTGFSAANEVDITATVLAANYQDAVAGVYTETVSLTIAP